jgi:hypothetical protein
MASPATRSPRTYYLRRWPLPFPPPCRPFCMAASRAVGRGPWARIRDSRLAVRLPRGYYRCGYFKLFLIWVWQSAKSKSRERERRVTADGGTHGIRWGAPARELEGRGPGAGVWGWGLLAQLQADPKEARGISSGLRSLF